MKKQQAQTKKAIHLSDVFVYTRCYEIEYGRRPKGRGCWAFSIGNTEAYKDVTKAFWTEGSCTYTQAVRQAKEEAIRRGVTCVYVLP